MEKKIKCEHCGDQVPVLYALSNDKYVCGHCFISLTQYYMPPVKWARDEK